jgi:DNA end-binding protein Ku
MAARAIWKGRIRFGDVDVPVKLYSAVQDRSIRFRLLHEKDGEPVTQRMIDPSTGDVVEHSEVRRAFPTEDGELVLLDDDELASIQPEPSRDIEITHFVDPAAITHQWYDRPYFLGPDDDDSAYAALADALRRRNAEGVARWVMRNSEYVGALRVHGDHLVLMTLRRAGEVVPASALDAPGGRALDRREVDMATQLVAALEDELDLTEFRDEYRDRVLELIEAKAEGKVVSFPAPPKKKETASLGDMLERSVRAAKKRRKSA